MSQWPPTAADPPHKKVTSYTWSVQWGQGNGPFTFLWPQSPGLALLWAQEAEGSVCPDPLGLQGLDGRRQGCDEFRFLSPVKTSRQGSGQIRERNK